MSQKFNEDWRKIFTEDGKNSKPTTHVSPNPKSVVLAQSGQIPHALSFVFGDKERKFTPYHHITIVELFPAQSRMKISFSSHYVELEGEKLDLLYYDILNQRVFEIIELDQRYSIIAAEDLPSVSKITFHLHSVI